MGGACTRCCASCVMCCYGCRKRQSYTQNMSNKFAERIWYCLMIFTFLATLADVFFWVSAANDSNAVNTGFFYSTGFWFPFYFTFQIIAYVTFGYIILLMIFGLLHMVLQERLQLHMVHKIGTVMSLIMTITLIIFVSIRLRHLWHFVPQLLEYIGPFMQLSAVTVMTILSWFVAGGLGKTKRKAGLSIPVASCLYFSVLLVLYITPIFIKSPCIMSNHHDDNPPKPLLFAHRGAEEIAPENTNISFTLALDDYNAHGIKSDVRISLDGVPYVFRDENLLRTTDVKQKFPERSKDPADMFTMDELSQLDIGSWYAKKNPYLNAWRLSEEKRSEYSEQRMLTLVEMFDLVAFTRNGSLLFDVRPPPSDHPYAETWLNTTVDVLTSELGLEEHEYDFWQAPRDSHYVFFINRFDNRSLNNVYNDIPFEDVRNDLEANITTNVWTVNEPWLFQYYWCAGAVSVTTSSIQTIANKNMLTWQLTPTHYMIMWILFDIASLIWVIVVFIIQITCRIRHERRLSRHVSDGSRYNYQFVPMSDRPSDMYAS